MTKRVLIILNIILVIALIAMAVKEKYPERLQDKYASFKSNEPLYLKNRNYKVLRLQRRASTAATCWPIGVSRHRLSTNCAARRSSFRRSASSS